MVAASSLALRDHRADTAVDLCGEVVQSGSFDGCCYSTCRALEFQFVVVLVPVGMDPPSDHSSSSSSSVAPCKVREMHAAPSWLVS